MSPGLPHRRPEEVDLSMAAKEKAKYAKIVEENTRS